MYSLTNFVRAVAPGAPAVSFSRARSFVSFLNVINPCEQGENKRMRMRMRRRREGSEKNKKNKKMMKKKESKNHRTVN